MFGTIRKHQSWLWILIITVVIFSFVIYFSPTAGSRNNRGTEEGYFGTINGELIKKADYLTGLREASLAYFLSTGSWPDSGARSNFDPQRETYQRLFLLHQIKAHNIEIDDAAVAQAAKNLLVQAGRGQAIPVDVFIQQGLGNRVTVEEFQNYFRHQLGIQQLISVVGLAGDLVTPQEAQAIYARENQEFASEIVFFSGTNYQMSVATPTPETLREFYTNQLSTYRLPERVQVNYVAFEATNFLADADKEIAKLTNFNAIVDQVYQQRGTNFYSEAKSPEEAKQKIRVELRHEQALMEARKKADAFANVLFEKDPMRAEDLLAFAKTNSLKVKTTAPFDLQEGPSEFDGGPNFAKEAFRLNDEVPLAGPIIGENGVYVIALAKKIPSEDPAFETVHDKVLADYKHTQAVSTARRAGANFARAVSAGLAAGKSFATVCSEQKVKPLMLPPISRASLNNQKLPQLDGRVSPYQFAQVAFETAPGKASDFSPTVDGGFVVHLQKQLPVDPAKMATDMPNFVKMVRQSRRQEAIQAWFQREAGKALRTPMDEQKSTLQPGSQPKS
jgi:hypothetical protein